jgi:hypothetical protein
MVPRTLIGKAGALMLTQRATAVDFIVWTAEPVIGRISIAAFHVLNPSECFALWIQLVDAAV